MGLWSYSIRELVRRRQRSALTLVGIAIGVATVAVSWTAGGAARQGYRDLFQQLSGPSNLEIYASGERPFDASAVGDLCRFPGIVEVRPIVQGMASIEGKQGPSPMVVIGGRSDRDRADGEMAIPPRLAETVGIESGQRIRVWGPTGPSEWLAVVEPNRTRDEGAVLTSLASAQSLFGCVNQVNRIGIALDETANRGEVKTSIARELPPGLSVREPADRAELASGLQSAAMQGLIGLTALAVVGAGTVVFQIMRMNVMTRRREIALMRTLGATTAQVEGTFLRQAIVLGVAGSIAGITLGVAMVKLAAWLVGSTSGLPIAAIGGDATVTGLCLLIGLCLSLISVWLPAKSYCRTPPLELFRTGTPSAPGNKGSRIVIVTTLAGFGLLLPGLWYIMVSQAIPIETRRSLLPPAMMVLLAGIGCIGPFVFIPLLRIAGWPLERFGGVRGTLAVRLLGRRPERTQRTASVVMIGVILAVGFGHTVLNTLSDVRGWCDRTIPAHFLIRASTPDPGFLLATALPESLALPLSEIEGVERVDTIAFIPTRVRGEPVIVLSRTFATRGDLPLDLRGADGDEIRRGLAKGGAVVARGLARTCRVEVGDSIDVETPKGTATLPVVGLVTEYAGGGNALYVDRATGHRLFGDVGANVFLVTVKAGQIDRAGPSLASLCAARGLQLQENAELRRTVDRVLQMLTGTLWILLAVVQGVAGMGIASVVTVTVREQERDVEILRAVGMESSAFPFVAAMQGVLIALCGLLPGAFLGIILAMLLDAMLEMLWGYRIPFCVQGSLLASVAGLSVAMGLAAGVASTFDRSSPAKLLWRMKKRVREYVDRRQLGKKIDRRTSHTQWRIQRSI